MTVLEIQTYSILDPKATEKQTKKRSNKRKKSNNNSNQNTEVQKSTGWTGWKKVDLSEMTIEGFEDGCAFELEELTGELLCSSNFYLTEAFVTDPFGCFGL